MTTFSTYTSHRGGTLWGMTLPQIVGLGIAVLPVISAVSSGRWSLAMLLLVAWLVAVFAVLVPIGGRSCVRWVGTTFLFAVAGLKGWLGFRSKASRGRLRDLNELDMPGCLSGVEILDAPPSGARQRRMAVIKNSPARTWAITARIEHDGIQLVDDATRGRYAVGLSELLETAARGELVDEIHLMVRSGSDDCAEREVWLRHNMHEDAPVTSVATNIEQLRWSRSCTRAEKFITFVVPDARLGREAREMGGALAGRMNTMVSLAREMGAIVAGSMGASSVEWLTSPELAMVTRTGFAPGDRAGIVQATLEAETNQDVNTEVPWALAGPSFGNAAIRHYAHDAWASVTSTLKLPKDGVQMGALAPVLSPSDVSERRCLTIVFPIETQSAAERKTQSQEFSQGVMQQIKARLGVKPRARELREEHTVVEVEDEMVRGAALIHPYALCTTTVPAQAHIAEFGRGLDIAIRGAGFAHQRLDMAQDLGFVAASIPLGISLKRG